MSISYELNELPNLPRLAKRTADAHKGTFGTAVLIGGSRGMFGAIAMAARAALLGGSGLVRALVPDCCLENIASFSPEVMTAPLRNDRRGRIALEAFPEILENVRLATALALGPGLSRSAGLDALAVKIVNSLEMPMLIDADGLNALATRKVEYFGKDRILTPHPGEFARLSGKKVAREDEPRIAAAVDYAKKSETVLVLKGHRTVITDGKSVFLNTTGNPGMATGGSGDVLTGLITALLCQSLSCLNAARLGVYLHGLAGDIAAKKYGEVSLTAGTILESIPEAINFVAKS